MKKIEIDRKPDHFKENWPGQYDYFSWMEFAAVVPQPLFLITTYKDGDIPNACFHSWGFWTGNKDGYLCLFSINKEGHTYQGIQRNKAWCINYPSAAYKKQCFATIELRDEAINEITEAGFTAERAKKVHAPRIAECFMNLECEYLWEKELYPGHVLIAGRAVNVAVAEEAGTMTTRERFDKFPLMYNVHEPLNLDSGESQDSVLGVLDILD